LRQRTGCGEARKSRADDLGPSCLRHAPHLQTVALWDISFPG
jgi:hypothetical protein